MSGEEKERLSAWVESLGLSVPREMAAGTLIEVLALHESGALFDRAMFRRFCSNLLGVEVPETVLEAKR